MAINAAARAEELTKNICRTVNGKLEMLVTDFSDTLQGKDTSRVVDLMTNQDGRFLFRVKFNDKSIDPLAAQEYGVPFFDIREKSDEEIEDHIKRQEFDFPLWFKRCPGFRMRQVMDYNVPFIVQVAGCNFHDSGPTDGCRFCFVDNKSNDGIDGSGKAWLSVDDCLDSFLRARERIRQHYLETTGIELNLRVLRVSGGEPTLALPWISALWTEVHKRGLSGEIFGQVDTNLSTEFLLQPALFQPLKQCQVMFLAGMKGCDTENIQNNTQTNQSLYSQTVAFRLLLKNCLNVFPQMYNPNPKTFDHFLELMDDDVSSGFSRRLHIGPLKLYGPNRLRLELEAQKKNLDPKIHVEKTAALWTSNYSEAIAIIDSYLRKNYGCGYRDCVRSDIALEL